MVYINLFSFTSMVWFAPVLTMLQNSSSSKNQGFIISIYYLLTTAAGMVSTGIVGNLNDVLDAP